MELKELRITKENSPRGLRWRVNVTLYLTKSFTATSLGEGKDATEALIKDINESLRDHWGFTKKGRKKSGK